MGKQNDVLSINLFRSYLLFESGNLALHIAKIENAFYIREMLYQQSCTNVRNFVAGKRQIAVVVD